MAGIETTAVHEDDHDIDLAGLLNVLVQSWKLIAAVFVVVFAVGLAYAVLLPPIYQADALIQIENSKGGGSLAGLSQLSESLGVDQSSVSGELQILRSREVLVKAIEATHATTRIAVDNRFPLIGDWMARRFVAASPGEVAPPFLGLSSYAWGGEQLELGEFIIPQRAFGQTFTLTVTADGFTLASAAGKTLLESNVLGERLPFELNGQEASIAVKSLKGREGTQFAIRKTSPYAMYNSLRGQLNVEEAGKSSQVVKLSYDSTNRQFATEFVNAVARTYLEQNVARRSAEARSRLAFLEQQLPLLKQNVEEKEEQLSQFRSSSGTISISDETRGLLGQAVSLENRRLELKLKGDELRQRYTAEHPIVKALHQQMAALEQASEDLGVHIDQLPQAQRDLLRLERDAQVNTQLYISLLNNAQALKVAEAGTIGNVRIIDFAVLPENPIKPKRPVIVAAAALLGLLLGIIIAFVLRFLRPAVQSAEVLEQRTGLTNYVSLPESEAQKKFRLMRPGQKSAGKLGEYVLALNHPDDPAVESLRSLRTGLPFALMGVKGKGLAILGATAAVGKSFVSANLATVLATPGQKVVLIDSDMRRGRLHEYFAYERKRVGLSDVLAAQKPLDDVLIRISDELWVLPAGTPPPNPGELLLNGQFKALVEQLETRFDRLVVDTAPLLPVADTLAIMQHMAAGFMVVRAEQSTLGEVQDAVAKLRNAGLEEKLKGTLFNGVRRYRLGYGASYKYYYTYK